jgi:biopolymer transport protein ExbD
MAFSTGGSDNSSVQATINVVPLIDVLLVLLIIFMVTAPLMSHKVKVELPKANVVSDNEVPPAPPVTVAVTESGAIFWNDQPVTRDLLESNLSVTAQLSPQPAVNVRGDATAKYRTIREVTDTAQAQGIRKVGFIAERERR